jgi:hypothetical protein
MKLIIYSSLKHIGSFFYTVILDSRLHNLKVIYDGNDKQV